MTQVEAVIEDLRKATTAALNLAQQLAAARQDPDDWRRMPPPDKRCEVSGFSRSKVIRLIEAKDIRGKHVGASRFYSAADMRQHIAKS